MRVVKAATVRPHEGGLRMRGRGMELIALASVAVLALAGVVAWLAPAFGEPDGEATPAFVDKIPPGYRDWKLISVAHEEGNFHSFAAVLGNEVAIQASREGTLPFPDGAIIAALHWRHVPSEENNKVFGRSQSFVAGTPTRSVHGQRLEKIRCDRGLGIRSFQRTRRQTCRKGVAPNVLSLPQQDQGPRSRFLPLRTLIPGVNRYCRGKTSWIGLPALGSAAL
jgi:hypothetical protein